MGMARQTKTKCEWECPQTKTKDMNANRETKTRKCDWDVNAMVTESTRDMNANSDG